MNKFDYFLQKQRISKALPFIGQNEKILDIGCSEGALFKMLQENNISFSGTGVDPTLDNEINNPDYVLLKENFPTEKLQDQKFTLITIFAVLEHIPEAQIDRFAEACVSSLERNGKLAVTVPSPLVDLILPALKRLRIIDGMEIEEHHGFDQRRTKEIFESKGLILAKKLTFQFALNNFYLFMKH